jgi:hypothetical protein
LEGLEISEVKFSEMLSMSRFDSEYFRPLFIKLQKRLEILPHTTLGAKSCFVAGPFGSEFHVENYEEQSGFRYIRGKDVKSFFVENGDNVYIPENDYTRLSEHSVKADDVLISVVGTLGNACIATSDDLPAIFSCKSTIIRKPEVNPYYLVSFLNSAPGKTLLLRNARGTVQLGLNLPDLRQLLIPLFSKNFQVVTEATIRKAQTCLRDSKSAFAQAEQTLLRALGLESWQPPEPLTYTRRASDAFTAGRLDADYFAPRVAELLHKLEEPGLTIGAVAPTRHERFVPNKVEEFSYIEIGDIQGDGTASNSRLSSSEAPSRATQHVRAGDVLTSTVRPIRRLSAVVTLEQDGFVCSSGFVVLHPQAVPAEVLLTYLRLPPICELMDLHTSASLYPAISETDLLALPFHPVTTSAEKEIVHAVQSAHTTRRQAHALLDAAKRAVEIAIEHNEQAALEYLAAFEREASP